MAKEAGTIWWFLNFASTVWISIGIIKFIGQKALKDAGVSYDQIEQAFVGYVYGNILTWFLNPSQN